MTRLLLMLILIISKPALSQELFTQTAREKIDVTVGFVGSSIEVFGSRKQPKHDVVIVVEGPTVSIDIWKKARILGAWVNASSVNFKSMPGYYQYATSLDENKETTQVILRKNGIGYDALFDENPVKTKNPTELKTFQDALKDKKRRDAVYFAKSAELKFLSNTFFRVHFEVPAAAPTGNYKIHSYLLQNGEIIQHDISMFKVEQVGLNAFIFDVAHKYSTLYALVCIFLAIFAGWLVSVLKVRP